MLIKENCKECSGTGLVFIETTSFFGILKKQIPMSCASCGGKGIILREPPCKFCNGEGLIGNEREICKVCNGTGYSDEFRWIPRRKLVPGTTFSRTCGICRRRTSHEIVTDIERVEVKPRWEEDLGQKVYIRERIKVACKECRDSYFVDIDPDFHQEETEEIREFLKTKDFSQTDQSRAYQTRPFGM